MSQTSAAERDGRRIRAWVGDHSADTAAEIGARMITDNERIKTARNPRPGYFEYTVKVISKRRAKAEQAEADRAAMEAVEGR